MAYGKMRAHRTPRRSQQIAVDMPVEHVAAAFPASKGAQTAVGMSDGLSRPPWHQILSIDRRGMLHVLPPGF